MLYGHILPFIVRVIKPTCIQHVDGPSDTAPAGPVEEELRGPSALRTELLAISRDSLGERASDVLEEASWRLRLGCVWTRKRYAVMR